MSHTSLTTRSSLLDRVRNNQDVHAWHKFDQQYGELIIRYCRRRGIGLADAEDIRQLTMQTLIKVMPTFQYLRTRGKFRNYLLLVVRQSIGRQLKPAKQAKVVAISDQLQFAHDEHLEDSLWETEWRYYHYRKAMATLQQSLEPQSAVVFEDLLYGHSVQDTARNRGLTEAAVYKIKSRVFRRVSALVAQQINDEERGLRV